MPSELRVYLVPNMIDAALNIVAQEKHCTALSSKYVDPPRHILAIPTYCDGESLSTPESCAKYGAEQQK